jgi:hypothetical protein
MVIGHPRLALMLLVFIHLQRLLLEKEQVEEEAAQAALNENRLKYMEQLLVLL